VFVEADNPGVPLRISLGDALSRQGRPDVSAATRSPNPPEDIADVPNTADAEPGRAAEVGIEVVEPMGAETYLYLNTGAIPSLPACAPATASTQANG